MKKIYFITPTKLSLLDITSMGDSIKRENVKTIGSFDTGFKHAIALLLRDNVDIDINVFGGKEQRGVWEESFTQEFSFGTYIGSDHKRDKELILVKEGIIFHGGSPMNQYDMREPAQAQSFEHKTGFAKALGHNWVVWMSLREIFSNMLDEGGYYSEDMSEPEPEEGTVITLSFDESSEFNEVWKNKHLYINEEEPLYELGNGVKVLNNPEGWLRIYKQNILVYEDKNKKSLYAYNINFGQIDERRILSNLYGVEDSIIDAIRSTKNEEYLRTVIKAEVDLADKEFLANRTNYYDASDLIHNIAFEIYTEFGKVDSYSWLIDSIKKRKDCKIGGKIITTVEDSLWGYSSTVTIESTPQSEHIYVEEEEDSEVVSEVSAIQQEINKIYNFKLDIDCKRALLKGSKVVADKYDNCLILDESFTVENDMPELIVQYLDLKEKGNVINSLSHYICKLLKR